MLNNTAYINILLNPMVILCGPVISYYFRVHINIAFSYINGLTHTKERNQLSFGTQ